MKKELTSLLIAVLMVIGVATPASAQLFGGSSTPDSEFTAAQTIDCDEDKTDTMECEAAYFMNEADPSLIGAMRMELGTDLTGVEEYFFNILMDEIGSDPAYTDVTSSVDWEFLDEYDNFAAFNVDSGDPTIPNMTMLVVLDNNTVVIFMFMEVDSDVAFEYTQNTLESGEVIVPPAPFKQVDPEDVSDAQLI